MQAFRALLKKEFCGCFKNGIAYIAMLVYLAAAVGMAFYYGAYLTMHDAALYALFMWQPLILMIVAPALTMRVWSEEYKTGTDEFLLTQPLADYVPVLAKFAAVWVLLSLMAIGLLPFIFSSAVWLHLDFANVVCCFIGLELVMMLFSALGCLLSCLNRQMMIAYLLSVTLIAFWIWLPLGYFNEVYKNFLFGEIGIVDVLYFVLFGSGLLSLNVLALTLKRTAMRYRALRFCGFAFLLFGGIILCLLALNNFARNKVDLTTAEIYTPKQRTVDIFKALKEPVAIEIYAAEDYLSENPANQHFFEQIVRFSKKYETLANGLITVEVLPVKAFSALEDNILRRGLYFEENAQGSRNYFGAFVKLRDGTETVIKQFIPQRYAYAEKDIDTAILKLTQPAVRKKIGIYLDGRQNLQPLEGILLNWENDYDFVNIPENISYFSAQFDLLILLNPKKLSALFLYALDQYIINGGKVAIFFDLYTRRQTDKINEQPLSIVPFLTEWGIDFAENLTNKGEIDNFFAGQRKQLNIFTAVQLQVSNKNLTIRPVIKATEGLVGMVLSGKFKSHYEENPFAEKNPSLRHLLWRGENKVAQVALIGDVDMLDDDNWIDEHSSDKNPYSLIARAANGEMVRNVVDYLVGNEVYRRLPINVYNSNEQNIWEQLQAAVYQLYAKQLQEYEAQMEQVSAELYQQSEGDEKLLRQMLQMSAKGQKLAQIEQKIERLQYKIKQEQIQKMYEIELRQIILIPLSLMLLLGLLLKGFEKRRKRKIREKFDD